MASTSHINEADELAFLRTRVAELEKITSQQARTASALEESRKLFDVFLSNTPALAWMKDEAGSYVFANRRFLDFVSSSGCTCIGSTDYDLWPSHVADGIRERDLAARANAPVAASVETFPTPAGERCFRVHRFAFRTQSGMVYVGGLGLDVGREESTREQTLSAHGSLSELEERNQRLFGSDLIGIMECSGENVAEANGTLLSWLGFRRGEFTDHLLNWRALTPERFRKRDDEALAELRRTGAWQPYEKELLDRDGKAIPVIVSAVGTGHGPDSFLCWVLNISVRRQIESRLLRSQKLESLGLISGGVAHDFNNLLATIMGNASLSLDAVSREHPAFRPLNEVVIASRRASDLTQQVLAYSGRANFSIRPVELSASVREIGSLLETTISKKISLRFDLGVGLPAIEGDEGQLQQVIMNLVINASDAIGEQPGEIVVRTREIRNQSGGREVLFEVRDTGCGMDEPTKARIFDPFFTTKPGGRGLGLAAVLGIVRNHYGNLTVESAPGMGTVFQAVFPAGSARAPAPQSTATCELWGSETILVADDDEGIRRMTRVALERLGYRILTAGDGREAVDIFRAHHDTIDMVLLDWAMPEMNGEEALGRMRQIDPRVTVVMSSGYAETETLERMGGPVLDGFVQKPYTTTLLAQRLREVLDRNRVTSYTRSSAENRADV